MKPTFLKYEKPLITAMVQADNPERIKELIDASVPEGADAFGMQFCQMKKEYRNRDTYRELFAYAGDRPVYVTNYRYAGNEGKSDDVIAAELAELAECGATLIDIMGDMFDRQSDEMAVDEAAIQKQQALIARLHELGAEVLMSSHVLKYTPAERVLEIALEHQRSSPSSAMSCSASLHESQILSS